MTDHCQENKSGLYDPSELRCSFGSGFHTDSERSVWIKTDVGEWTCDPWCVKQSGISTVALKQSSFSAEAFVRLLPSWDTKHLWPIELRWHKNKCIFPRLSTQSEGVVYSLSANISLRALYFFSSCLATMTPCWLADWKTGTDTRVEPEQETVLLWAFTGWRVNPPLWEWSGNFNRALSPLPAVQSQSRMLSTTMYHCELPRLHQVQSGQRIPVGAMVCNHYYVEYFIKTLTGNLVNLENYLWLLSARL